MTGLAIAKDLTLPVDAVIAAADRIWAAVDRRGPDECWPWKRSCNTDGYGHLSVGGRLQIASRMIFYLVNGWLPPVVMHSCDNPPCGNPRHLLPGTKAVNNADKMAKGRFRPCVGERNGSRLHPERLSRGDRHYARTQPERLARGERHGCAKVTTVQVEQMRQLFAAGGRTKASIAREFAISQSHIGRILRSESWS